MIDNNTPGSTDGSLPLPANTTQQVQVAAGALFLDGLLHTSPQAGGIVLLAQGSKHVESMAYVNALAEALHGANLATLSVHLLTDNEEALDTDSQFFRYNTSILSQRIRGITDWLAETPTTQNYAIGYFGIGPTAAAALQAAAERPDPVHAIVAANGRTDLVQSYLERILAPVLLIAGGQDSEAITMNRDALSRIQASVEANKRFEAIAGANGTSMFEQPEMLQKMSELASQWFSRHLVPIV